MAITNSSNTDPSTASRPGACSDPLGVSLDPLREIANEIDGELGEKLASTITEVQRELADAAQRVIRFSRAQADAVVNSVLLMTELEDARDAAEKASSAKTRFLTNMSHEIRTPMTAILGYAEILREAARPSSEMWEYLDTIVENGEHLLEVVNDVLDLSKIEHGWLDLEIRPTSIPELLHRVQRIVDIRAKSKDLDFRIQIETDDVPESMVTDPVRLRQVLINLAGNAIKFTATGEVVLGVGRVRDDVPAVRFRVTDSGPGIDDAVLESVFEPFVQIGDGPETREQGSGLGLAIAKSLVECLDGSIAVTSRPGEGSTFTVTLPLSDVDDEALCIEAGPLQPRSRNVSSPEKRDTSPGAVDSAAAPAPAHRVLVAEDNRVNQTLVRKILIQCGVEVELAGNGLDAEAAVHEAVRSGRPFSLILMDLRMPVRDGYEAIRNLRGAGVTTPIVALTAHAVESERRRCMELGCNEFATKPYNKSSIRGLVERYAGD